MKSLRLRLVLWFGCSFIALFAAISILTYRSLDNELRRKSVQRDYPAHPDWKLHGSYSESEIRDITGELLETLLVYSVPLVLISIGIGVWLSRKSIAPIASVNRQLREVGPPTLARRIALSEVDPEFRDLVRHINDLLERLQTSFVSMSEYAAKVAHELRTPLAILRLKIEQADARIAPELAEEIHEELSRLSHVVDQSLLIAKAGQGRLVLEKRTVDMMGILTELVQDFQLLAAAAGRNVLLEGPKHCWISADPRYLKQVLHTLLTNAIKHGKGDVCVRLVSRERSCSLLIVNQIASIPPRETLGLGLRLVRAILGVDTAIRYTARVGWQIYAARLAFNCVADPMIAGTEQGASRG